MKSPLINLIVVSIICGLSLVGYGAGYATIAAKSSAAAILQGQIDTKIGNINRLNTTRAVLTNIANDEATVQDYFVPETGVVAFITGLEARGHDQGSTVSVLSVATGGVSSQPTLEFTLSIAGTFDAVMRTIGTIEYEPYAISVSTISVGQDTNASWHADVKLLVGSRAAVPTTATTTP